MTNEMIIQIAMEQSAIDSNCKVEDFKQFQNVVTVSKENVNARRYLKLPHICDLYLYMLFLILSFNGCFFECPAIKTLVGPSAPPIIETPFLLFCFIRLFLTNPELLNSFKSH